MGSKCCNCETTYWLEEKQVKLVAKFKGNVSITPSRSEVTPSNKYCEVTLYNPPNFGEKGFFDVTILDPKLFKRQIWMNPKFNCTCLNVNGGMLVNRDPWADTERVLRTKTRTSNGWHWDIRCPSFPGVSIQKIPCVGRQDYDLTAVTMKDVCEYKKYHKCGKGCPGDGNYYPKIMDQEIPIFTELVKTSILHQF